MAKKKILFINQEISSCANVASNSDLSMEECFRMADSAMYQMKEVAHKKEAL